MNKSQPTLDVSVLILFFNRSDVLEKVFAEVRKARPARLFLYQDGPRGERDLPGIAACREVVSRVDWPCEVHQLYQEKNFGCDPSEYISQKWAFSMTDKCIVLEDDDVPTQSFFTFCKEMLDRYEHDERIGMVCGMNYDERTTDVADDYFFSTVFAISGWASWRRVVDLWDEHYTFLDDADKMARLNALARERRLRKDFVPMCRAHRDSGKAYYETIFHASLLLQSQLAIVPVVNQINNIGVVADSTHFSGTVEMLPAGYRRIFTMGRHEMKFPLRHPAAVIDHVDYRRRVYRMRGWNHPWVKVGRSFEELWLHVRHGQWKQIGRAIGNRFGILMHGRKFN